MAGGQINRYVQELATLHKCLKQNGRSAWNAIHRRNGPQVNVGVRDQSIVFVHKTDHRILDWFDHVVIVNPSRSAFVIVRYG
jgi:hypothetical protein